MQTQTESHHLTGHLAGPGWRKSSFLCEEERFGNAPEFSSQNAVAHYFFMAVKILFAIIAAYVRNIIFLPRTLLLRRTKKDFLDVA